MSLLVLRLFTRYGNILIYAATFINATNYIALLVIGFTSQALWIVHSNSFFYELT